MEKKRILLVDDEKDFTRMVKLNLEKSGKYTVEIENKGNNALSAARRIKPDLIILDILMPGVDGLQVLEYLKKDDITISIPVIMLTALMTDEARVRASSLYNEAYLEKPVTVLDLEAEIEKVLKVRGSK